MSSKRYKCPYCDTRKERKELIQHIEKNHSDMIPENYSATRVVFEMINHKDHGVCRVCKKDTPWNEKAGRFDVLCGNPKCKETMREEYKKNMLRVKGTYNILNDPEQQQKMLANRSISGKYKFSDGGELVYTGTYEKKCLEFMDVVMQIPSKDIMAPGPTLEYEYNGEKHFYITDFYYVPYNLIIEVKDGGDNLNTKESPGMKSSRERTIAKEKLITDRGEYNYIRLTNNQFSQLIEVFMDIKKGLIEGDKSPVVKINESSLKSNIDKDFKSKGNISINSLKKERITQSLVNKYSDKYKYLKHLRIQNNTEGYFFIKDNEIVVTIMVETKDDNTKWIQALEINSKYRGYGLGKQVLNYACKNMGAKYLSVYKDNLVAYEMYKKYGFKTFDTTDYMYFMTIDKNKPIISYNRFNESVILESQYKNLYFISDKNMDKQTINPRIPDNFLTKNGYEDNTTPRVCMSTSIGGCLSGMSSNVDNKEFYVHVPVNNCDVYKPSIKEVPDVNITNEVWIKNSVKLKCIGIIKAHDNGKDGKEYKYGDKTAMLYTWDYEWINKINESNILEKSSY